MAAAPRRTRVMVMICWFCSCFLCLCLCVVPKRGGFYAVFKCGGREGMEQR